MEHFIHARPCYSPRVALPCSTARPYPLAPARLQHPPTRDRSSLVRDHDHFASATLARSVRRRRQVVTSSDEARFEPSRGHVDVWIVRAPNTLATSVPMTRRTGSPQIVVSALNDSPRMPTRCGAYVDQLVAARCVVVRAQDRAAHGQSSAWWGRGAGSRAYLRQARSANANPGINMRWPRFSVCRAKQPLTSLLSMCCTASIRLRSRTPL